ncbi:hypothetical protein ACIBU0_27090 [Streptomyces sp. NPDC049627]|uniref:hypothetical protein n=1 Tax=Streptomyces sp. NPDC049627 TaxID=3365595 RepID=UPI0037B96BB2
MRYVVLGALIALSSAVAVSGVAELLTGWIHPWERAGVLRPVPHGLGLVLTGSGLGCFAGIFVFTPTGHVLLTLLAAGAGVFLTGTALLGVSRFPDR